MLLASIIAGWLFLGALGASGLWFDWMRSVERVDPIPCPTPKAILAGAAFSVLGPLLLFAALVVLTGNWLTEPARRDSWWSRPICKRN